MSGDAFREAGQRMRFRDPGFGGLFAERGLGTGPDDVLYRQVVAVEGLFARVGVDQPRERRRIQSEVVAESRILPEVVGVVGIVVGRSLVARDQDQTRSDLVAQGLAARCIGFGWKHGMFVL